jgi:hypothetical protein
LQIAVTQLLGRAVRLLAISLSWILLTLTRATKLVSPVSSTLAAPRRTAGSRRTVIIDRIDIHIVELELMQYPGVNGIRYIDDLNCPGISSTPVVIDTKALFWSINMSLACTVTVFETPSTITLSTLTGIT